MRNQGAIGMIRQKESSPAEGHIESIMNEKENNKLVQEIERGTKGLQVNDKTKLSKLGKNFLTIANQFKSINNEQTKRKRKPRKKEDGTEDFNETRL